MRSTQPEMTSRSWSWRSAVRPLGIADEAGRPADEADGTVPGQLEPAHRHQQHEVAEVEARRGRVEAAVVGDGAGGHRRAQRVEIGVVGDHAPPLEIVEDRGARFRRCHGYEYTERPTCEADAFHKVSQQPKKGREAVHSTG